MSIDDMPDRFRLILDFDVEITDKLALRAAQVRDSVNQDGEIQIDVPTDFPWFLVSTPLMRALMEAGNNLNGLTVHSGSSIPRIPNADGSYGAVELPAFPPFE